jgi:hypothetical protein
MDAMERAILEGIINRGKKMEFLMRIYRLMFIIT